MLTSEDLFNKVYPVKNAELKESLIALTEIKYLNRKEVLFEQDNKDSMMCFLSEGIAIAYEIDSNGRPICLKIFHQPGDILAGGGWTVGHLWFSKY